MSWVKGFALCASVWACVACGSDGTGPVDGLDAGPAGVDGGSQVDCPLTVEFQISPAVPGVDSQTNITVDEVRIELGDLRLISDTTDETIAPSYELRWDSSRSPASLCFDQAPPGRYQEAQFDIERYLLKGTLSMGGEFTVDDSPSNLPGSFGIQPSVVLEPGGTATIVIEVRVGEVLSELALLNGAEDVEITEESDAILVANFREAIEDALEGE